MMGCVPFGVSASFVLFKVKRFCIFNAAFWFQVSGFSPAAGLKSGRFNHQETVPFWRSFT